MENKDMAAGSGKRSARHVFWGIGFVLVFLLAFGLCIRYLWNWLMPEIFGVRTITYWQAVGLLLLARLLFGRAGQRRDHAGYLTGRYGFRNLIGRGDSGENADRDS